MTATTDARLTTTTLLADMAGGDLESARRTIDPSATNREAVIGPPDSRMPGPEGFYATALWLRGMFSDLRWEVHEAVTQGDLVVGHVTMRGRHTGPLTRYSPDGDLVMDAPATGREFAITQSHWFRFRDGLLVEHWMNHDGMGLLAQLGLAG